MEGECSSVGDCWNSSRIGRSLECFQNRKEVRVGRSPLEEEGGHPLTVLIKLLKATYRANQMGNLGMLEASGKFVIQALHRSERVVSRPEILGMIFDTLDVFTTSSVAMVIKLNSVMGNTCIGLYSLTSSAMPSKLHPLSRFGSKTTCFSSCQYSCM